MLSFMYLYYCSICKTVSSTIDSRNIKEQIKLFLFVIKLGITYYYKENLKFFLRKDIFQIYLVNGSGQLWSKLDWIVNYYG
jgi:hypothetical protein